MRYLEVHDGEVVGGPYLVADDDEGRDFAEEQKWVGPVDDLDPEPGVGWRYDGRTFMPPEDEGPEPMEPPPTLTADEVEQLREILHRGES